MNLDVKPGSAFKSALDYASMSSGRTWGIQPVRPVNANFYHFDEFEPAPLALEVKKQFPREDLSGRLACISGQCSSVVEQRFRNSERSFSPKFLQQNFIEFDSMGKR